MLYLTERQAEEITEHARREAPYEACGLLAGNFGAGEANDIRKAKKVYQMTNTDKSPVSFFMDPKEQLKIMKEIRNSGLEMLGIYHSHPLTQAYPSAHDIELAYYPEVSYVIVSLKDRDKPLLRAFRIEEGKIREEELKIYPHTNCADGIPSEIGVGVYRVGTRTSPLALKQVEEVKGLIRKVYPSIELSIVGIDTYGDRDKNTPISEIEGSDFFTRELDDALLSGKIDFAIHSAKDLPDTLREGLVVAGITKSIDPYDVLISKHGLKLGELPRGARIGTSSLRRKEQLKRYRNDFEIVDIRGTIEERLSILDRDDRLDGIVLAAAGLVRLGLESRITQRIPFDILKPHPFQGSLAIVARKGDEDIIRICGKINEIP